MAFSVGFDISALDPGFKEHSQRGIGRYVRELSRYCESNSAAIERELGVKVGYFSCADLLLPQALDSAIDLLPLGRQTIKQQLSYPLLLNHGPVAKFDLLHFPAHMDAPSWSNRRTVVTVLDLIPLVLKELYQANHPNWRFNFARWLESRAIRRADLILAISECTARDTERVLGVPRERIVVTPLGVDTEFFDAPDPLPRPELDRLYGIKPNREILLYVGGIDKRKNYPLLVSLAKELRERKMATTGSSQLKEPPVIAMVGRIERDREYPKLLELIKTHQVEQDLLLLGYLPDFELRQLMASSALFIFPSLYEGFGLPILEAMAAGLPVVCSNRSAMPEVAGDAALMFDPDSVSAASAAVWQVLTNTEQKSKMIEIGQQQARKFTWQRTGELTVSAYSRVLQLLR